MSVLGRPSMASSLSIRSAVLMPLIKPTPEVIEPILASLTAGTTGGAPLRLPSSRTGKTFAVSRRAALHGVGESAHHPWLRELPIRGLNRYRPLLRLHL